MKLFINRHLAGLSNRYTICDERWNARYYVRSDFFSIGNRIHVFNANRCEIATIHRKLISYAPIFQILVDGEHMGAVKKKFSFLDTKYGIDYNGWRLEGDLFLWEYSVYSGKRLVVRVSREPEAFVIDIGNPSEEKAGVFLVIAMNAIEKSESIYVS